MKTKISNLFLINMMFSILTSIFLTSSYKNIAKRNLSSEKISIGEGKFLTKEQIQNIRNQLPKTKEVKNFFHWTTLENGIRWTQNGRIDNGEINFLNKPSNTNQAYGPGFYMAEGSKSSDGYGNFPVYITMDIGTPIYDNSIVEKIAGFTLDNKSISALGEHINFIRNISNDWWLTHNSKNTNNIKPGHNYGARIKFQKSLHNLNNFYSILEAFKAMDLNQESIMWLNSFSHLVYYFDGISLLRAIKVAPNNPWSQFEPEHFENFKRAREEIINYDNSLVGNTYTMKELSPQIIDIHLKNLFEKIQVGENFHYRNHSIRAGGDRKVPGKKGGYFELDPILLQNLIENPYLKVEYHLSEDKKNFLVSYEYPSVNHWEKFQSKLTPKTIEAIKNDLHSKEVLNQLIINDLLENLISSIKHSQFNEALFLRNFISIHPFSDRNGRIGRLLVEKILKLTNQNSITPMFLSDLDILVSEKSFEKIVQDSKNYYRELLESLLSEVYLAHIENRMPKYYDLESWNNLFKSLTIFSFNEKVKLTNNDLELIRTRDFSKLFTKLKGSLWSITNTENSEKGIQFALENGADGFLDDLIDDYKDTFDKNLSDSTLNIPKAIEVFNKLKEIKEFKRTQTFYSYCVEEFKILFKDLEEKIGLHNRAFIYNKQLFEIINDFLTPVEIVSIIENKMKNKAVKQDENLKKYLYIQKTIQEIIIEVNNDEINSFLSKRSFEKKINILSEIYSENSDEKDLLHFKLDFNQFDLDLLSKALFTLKDNNFQYFFVMTSSENIKKTPDLVNFITDLLSELKTRKESHLPNSKFYETIYRSFYLPFEKDNELNTLTTELAIWAAIFSDHNFQYFLRWTFSTTKDFVIKYLEELFKKDISNKTKGKIFISMVKDNHQFDNFSEKEILNLTQNTSDWAKRVFIGSLETEQLLNPKFKSSIIESYKNSDMSVYSGNSIVSKISIEKLQDSEIDSLIDIIEELPAEWKAYNYSLIDFEKNPKLKVKLSANINNAFKNYFQNIFNLYKDVKELDYSIKEELNSYISGFSDKVEYINILTIDELNFLFSILKRGEFEGLFDSVLVQNNFNFNADDLIKLYNVFISFVENSEESVYRPYRHIQKSARKYFKETKEIGFLPSKKQLDSILKTTIPHIYEYDNFFSILWYINERDPKLIYEYALFYLQTFLSLEKEKLNKLFQNSSDDVCHIFKNPILKNEDELTKNKIIDKLDHNALKSFVTNCSSISKVRIYAIEKLTNTKEKLYSNDIEELIIDSLRGYEKNLDFLNLNKLNELFKLIFSLSHNEIDNYTIAEIIKYFKHSKINDSDQIKIKAMLNSFIIQ